MTLVGTRMNGNALSTKEFYVTGNKKSVSVTDNSRLLANAPTDARDENIPYYVAKLQQLYKKLTEFSN